MLRSMFIQFPSIVKKHKHNEEDAMNLFAPRDRMYDVDTGEYVPYDGAFYDRYVKR